MSQEIMTIVTQKELTSVYLQQSPQMFTSIVFILCSIIRRYESFKYKFDFQTPFNSKGKIKSTKSREKKFQIFTEKDLLASPTKN